MPFKHKDLLSPSLMHTLDNKLIYVGLSCPLACHNIIKFGHWQTAHHGRTPEDSVCELCVTALVRYTQEGQEDIWSPVVCVCYFMLSEDGLLTGRPFPTHTPSSPSWEELQRTHLEHFIITQQ